MSASTLASILGRNRTKRLRSVFMILLKATREASSMQTWRNSQPTPRLLLWPLRSPLMRWPI
jgi:hypothetical protein